MSPGRKKEAGETLPEALTPLHPTAAKAAANPNARQNDSQLNLTLLL